MEPRFFKRGNLECRNAGPENVRNASMEPRFFKRGNLWLSRIFPFAPCVLQWNHVFSNVEILQKLLDKNDEARKLQWNHVFSNVEMPRRSLPKRLFLRASMEPRFFKRGNKPCRAKRGAMSSSFNGTTFFQTWKSENKKADRGGEAGFNGTTFFQTWKSKLAGVPVVLVNPLQWNHVFSNVEMKQDRQNEQSGVDRFNGTTFFQTWKYRKRVALASGPD